MRIVNDAKDYISKSLSFFKNGNRFLVIEILNHETKATFIKTDFEKRTFHILKSLSGNSLDELVPKLGKLERYHIVFVLDPKFATTLYTRVPMVRENSKEPIDDGDLDNIISRAIWSFFDRQRSKVAAKMGISDLDVILSDVQINSVKLDGHKVVNPLGFQAKTAEIQLSLTFTPREFINRAKQLLPKENIIFIGEDGPTFARLLSHKSEDSPFVLVNLFPEATNLFAADGNSIAYLDKLEWGQKHLVQSVADQFGTSERAAHRILERYIQGSASPYFIRRLENVLLEELQSLARGLQEALRRVGHNNLYLHSFFPLPQVVLSNSFKNKFNRAVRFQLITNNIISEKFNHELKLKKGEELPNALATLTGILLTSLVSQSDKVSKIAKRRIRWLT